MKLLVTGGAGYIGGTVAQLLIDSGHEVTVYDNLSKGYRQAVPPNATLVEGDIRNEALLAETFQKGQFDAVLHFAALIEAGESMRDPASFLSNNVAGSTILIQAAVTHGVKRFVFSSTAGVYAGDNALLTEDNAVGPASVYGETKLMVEHILGWYQRIFGLQYAVLRYFNAAGALPDRGEAHQPETHLIPLVLQVALGQRESIAIFGDDYPTPDGTCVRDYIHIADLTSAHLLALEALGDCPTLLFNLGNGLGYSVKEVIETARRVTGHPIPAVVKPRRPGDAAILVADASRIKYQLGWEPRIPKLEDIIASAWEWHQSHPQGYSHVD